MRNFVPALEKMENIEDLKEERKQLQEQINFLKGMKTDMIDAEVSNKSFPEDYIKGKKEVNSIREYYERQLKDQRELLSKAVDKYFKLLKECNNKFQEIRELKGKLREQN